MEESNALAMMTATTITDDAQVLQCLNVNLQVRVHNLESEVSRLKNEINSYKGKSKIYESLTKDLKSLRTQFDKTAAALLRKCEAYEGLKKELTALKSQRNISPKNIESSKLSKPSPLRNIRARLALYEDNDYSSDDEIYPGNYRRPSIGSCGNLTRQISAEETMPVNYKAFVPPSAPLRNRLLIKLHSIKSASTESLESTGRRSLKPKDQQRKPMKPTAIPPKKSKINLDNSLSTKNTTTTTAVGIVKAQPPFRPALGQSNGQRLIKINTTGVKRSNSSASNKSASSNKPAFRI